MKTTLTILVIFVCQMVNAQFSQKMMDNMFADAGKIYESNATSATLFGDFEKSKKVSKIDGTSRTFMAYFPITAQSVSEASVPSPFSSSTFYRVKVMLMGGDAECLATNFAYERQYDIDELMPDFAKKNSFIEEEIDANSLRARIGDILEECGGNASTKAVLQLETQGKKGATVIISKAIFPIEDMKGANDAQFIERWTRGDAANTVNDEALLATIENHLERNWKGYDVTTVNITFIKYDYAKNFEFEGAFIATDDEGICQAGDLFGSGGKTSSNAYYINAGNNTMGFSPVDCELASQVANR